jgi:hypothetical protein
MSMLLGNEFAPALMFSTPIPSARQAFLQAVAEPRLQVFRDGCRNLNEL